MMENDIEFLCPAGPLRVGQMSLKYQTIQPQSPYYSATEPVLFSHRDRIIQPQSPYYSATEPVLFPCLHFVLSCPLLLKGIVQGDFLTKIENILTCWSFA